MAGSTIHNMNVLLETRLDVAVLRSNFARTVMQSRQFVNHGHFLVNGKKVNIPSYKVKPGDVIEVTEKHKWAPLYKSLLEEFGEFEKDNKNGSISSTSWITVDTKGLKITVDKLPETDDFDSAIDMTKIIEYYSK